MNTYTIGRIAAAIVIIFILGSCETSETILPDTGIQNSPEWLRFPPQEESYYFGIGEDTNLSEAKMKSIINIGQQFSVRVKSTLYEKIIVSDGRVETIMASIDEQLTNQEVVGAKFYDQYQDENGNYWVLTRAALNCILDVTESVLLSYKLELKQDEILIEELIRDVEYSMADANQSYYKEPRKPGEIIIVENESITIDGSLDDWNYDALAVSPENLSIKDYRDITAVYLAKDEVNLYIRVDFRGGRPKAGSSDNTYDLAFNSNGRHIELWCLKSGSSATVNITGINSYGGLDKSNQQQITRGCLTKTGEGFLESRFPLDSIRENSSVPIIVNSSFRVRDGGREEYDSIDLPAVDF